MSSTVAPVDEIDENNNVRQKKSVCFKSPVVQQSKKRIDHLSPPVITNRKNLELLTKEKSVSFFNAIIDTIRTLKLRSSTPDF